MTCQRINNRWILSRSDKKAVIQYINKTTQKRLTNKHKKERKETHSFMDTKIGKKVNGQTTKLTLTHQRGG